MERKAEKEARISLLDRSLHLLINRLPVLLAVITLFSCQHSSDEVHILFTGDVLLSRLVKKEYDERKTFPWEELKPVFQSADLVVGNLEGAVGDSTDQIRSGIKSPVFAIDSGDIRLLSKAGFGMMTLENNHALDLGKKGKENTFSTLLKNQVIPVEFENSPRFITIKNTVIAIIAVNTVLCRDSSRYSIPSIALKQKLRLAKSLSNIVIVSIHWGSELLEWPNQEQRRMAHWLIANGADVIIGHHPHVIQHPEIIDGKPVFFSLGNHLFDQKYPITKEGLIAELTIKDGKFYCSGIKTKTKRGSFYPACNGKYDFTTPPIACNKKLLQLNGYTIRPASTDRDGKIILSGYKNNQLAWKAPPLPIVTISAHQLTLSNAYLFSLQTHYSNMDNEINLRPYVYDVGPHGLIARWRGSALAWPLLDAQIFNGQDSILCVLHRGDSYLTLDKDNKTTRISAYKWNGFGFNGMPDSIACKYCQKIAE